MSGRGLCPELRHVSRPDQRSHHGLVRHLQPGDRLQLNLMSEHPAAAVHIDNPALHVAYSDAMSTGCHAGREDGLTSPVRPVRTARSLPQPHHPDLQTASRLSCHALTPAVCAQWACLSDPLLDDRLLLLVFTVRLLGVGLRLSPGRPPAQPCLPTRCGLERPERYLPCRVL